MRKIRTTILTMMAMTAMLCSAIHAEDVTEFIWTEAPFPSAHASTIVEAADGTLLSAWFGGTDEGNKDVGVWFSRKVKGGAWTPPVEVFKEPNEPAWNPVLFRDAKDVIWLFFKFGPSPQEWSGGYLQSTDQGKTWGAPVFLPSGLLGPIRCKPIILSNGNILSGTSFESYKTWASWMELSEDGGASWQKYGPLAFPSMEDNQKGTIQPTLLEIEPGVVRGLMRTRGLGKIATSVSNDGGKTWEPVTLTEMDHPGAGIDAVKLKDGRCVMIYNPAKKGRTPVSLAVSHDGGATWADFFEIERLAPNTVGELSYPAIIQSADGSIHFTYTWNRKRIKHGVIGLERVPTK